MCPAICLGAQPLLLTETRTSVVPAPAAIPERVVVRCPRCRLVQYSTASNRCRRCRQTLTVEPPPPPPPRVPPKPNVAAGVRDWRRMRGLTQKQLAAASQLPRTYISRIENGRIVPGLVTLERVAGALSVSLPSLLGPQEEPAVRVNGSGTRPEPRNGHSYPSCGTPANGTRNAAESLACLRELLRYSGQLTGAQRQLVLARVRQMVPPSVLASH